VWSPRQTLGLWIALAVLAALPMAGCGRRVVERDGELVRSRDGARMKLIPAGEFLMGDDQGTDEERPAHPVWVDAFYMDVHEVTNAQYRRFVEATGWREPVGFVKIDGRLRRDFRLWADPRFNQPQQPVVCVKWSDAVAYCEWVGARLPTEAEWERAARGGLVGKKYPWGDEEPTGRANVGGKGPVAVGSYPANGFGLHDMAGNVWEWCADWLDSGYYTRSPRRNPTGPPDGRHRLVRGGGWLQGPFEVRCAARHHGCDTSNPEAYPMYGWWGFRCALSARR